MAVQIIKVIRKDAIIQKVLIFNKLKIKYLTGTSMIKKYDNNLNFLKENKPLLLEDEIKNNLILGLAESVDPKESHFVSSVIEDRILLGLLAGKNLIISSNTLEKDVYIDLVNHMKDIPYPGIIGSKEECLVYKQVFEEVINQRMITSMDQRIYSCKEVISNYDLNNVRLATMDDFNVIRHWYHAFNEEVEGPVSMEETDTSLKKVIVQTRLFVLELNGVVVSMAGKARETKNTQTVGLVYTPSKYRNKGYASIVVEYVTRHILEYKEMATLYTDLSNPTSNSIYMKIGYVPHCDSIVLDIKK